MTDSGAPTGPQSSPGGSPAPGPAGGWGAPSPPPGWGPPPPAWGGAPWGGPQAPKPGVVPLRPLNFGEVLDGAFTTVQRYPKILLGMSTAVMAVLMIASFLAFFVGFGDLLSASPAEVRTISDATWISFGATMLGLLLVMWIASSVLTGMIVVTVSRGVLGRPITVGEAWAGCRPHLLRLLGLSLLLGAAYVVGFVVLTAIVVAGFFIHPAVGVLALLVALAAGIFAAIVIGTRTSVAAAALVLETRPMHPGLPGGDQERLGVVASLGRSWHLIKGRTGRTFGILFVANVIATVISSVIQTAFTLLSAGLGGSTSTEEAFTLTSLQVVPLLLVGIGYLAAAVLQVAFLSGVNALVYVDARMRTEGLDIELAQASTAGFEASSPWVTR